MEVNLTPDMQERLANSAAKQGCHPAELVQDVIARYLADEARFFEAVADWTDEERQAAKSHVEEAYLQAERGDLIDSSLARREIEARKNDWRQERSRTR